MGIPQFATFMMFRQVGENCNLIQIGPMDKDETRKEKYKITFLIIYLEGYRRILRTPWKIREGVCTQDIPQLG